MFVSPELSRLDAESYRHRPAAYDLAVIVGTEIEAYRAERAEIPTRINVISGLLSGEPRLVVAIKPWHSFLTDPPLVERCAMRKGVSPPAFLESVIRELSPPNWETLFYMKAWWEEIRHSSKLARIAQELVNERKRIAIAHKDQATEGARRKHQKHYGDAKKYVQDRWSAEGTAAYEDNKSAFARVYVRRVLQEFGTEVTELTITRSWLKGMR